MPPPLPTLLPLDHGVIDLERRVARVGGREVVLTAQEVGLLEMLAEHPNQDVARDTLLARVWGYRGRQPSRAVDIAVSRLRAKIEPDRTFPRHILSTPGVGYRLVLAERPGGPAPPSNTRSPITPLYGRDRALTELTHLLEHEPMLTLHGVGGIGKTRLALALVDRVRPGFPGGSWYIDAGALRSGADLVAAIGRTLDRRMPEPSPGEAEAALLAHLAECPPTLFVLDDVNEVPNLARMLDIWARVPCQAVSGSALAGHRWLLTRYAPVGIRLERAWAVNGLAEAAAADLFGRCAGRRPSDALLAALDGVPLALEIAGAWARTLEDDALVDAVRSGVALPDEDPTRPERHRSVDRCIHASLRLLPPSARELTLSVSAFEGPFLLEDADAVLGRCALFEVRTLVDAGLLRPVSEGYRLLVPVRLAARRLVGAAGDAERVAAAARACLVRFSRQALTDMQGADPARALDAVAARIDDLRAAASVGDAASRVVILEALGPYLRARGPVAEHLIRVRAAWEQGAAAGWPPPLRARALVAGAVAPRVVTVPSLDWVAEALPWAEDSDTRDALLALLGVARSGEDACGGLGWLDEQRPPESPAGGPGRCEVELARAMSAVIAAPFPRMEAARARSWEVAEQFDHAWARGRQALADARLGLRIAEVGARVGRAERLLAPLGDRQSLMLLDCVRAIDVCLRGLDVDGAAAALARARRHASDLGSVVATQYVERHHARLDLALGRPDDALARVVHHSPRLWVVHEIRATAWALLGRLDDARVHALAAAPDPVDRNLQESALSVAVLGAVLLLRGEPDEAARRLDQALSQFDPRDPRRVWYPSAWMRVLASPPGDAARGLVEQLATSGAEDAGLNLALPLLEGHASGAPPAHLVRRVAALESSASTLLRLQLRIQRRMVGLDPVRPEPGAPGSDG